MRTQVGMTPANYIDLYNLRPGGRYKFRVTARNRYGCGQPVDTVDYADILEAKYLPYFHQQLPGETKILLHHGATLQCHVRKTCFSFRFVRHFHEFFFCRKSRVFAVAIRPNWNPLRERNRFEIGAVRTKS